jgi:ComF family protein
MRPIGTAVCSLCGEGLLSTYAAGGAHGEPLCGLCQRKPPVYRKAVAFGSYEGALRDLIHLLKYERVLPSARVLGGILRQAIDGLQPAFGGHKVVVIPVPLFRGKLRQRGFNQSEMIARAALKNALGLGQLVLASNVLERVRETQSQIGLSRHQRRANMRGAFAAASPEAVKGSFILLVDDVLTTGTTASECARVLLKAGAAGVWVATVARTLKLGAAEQFADPEREEATPEVMQAA